MLNPSRVKPFSQTLVLVPSLSSAGLGHDASTSRTSELITARARISSTRYVAVVADGFVAVTTVFSRTTPAAPAAETTTSRRGGAETLLLTSSSSLRAIEAVEGSFTAAAIIADDTLEPFVVLGTSLGHTLVCTLDGRVRSAVSFRPKVPVIKLWVDAVTPHTITNPNTLKSAFAHTRSVVDAVIVVHGDGTAATISKAAIADLVASLSRFTSSGDRAVLDLDSPAKATATSAAPTAPSTPFPCAGISTWLRHVAQPLIRLDTKGATVADVAVCSRLCPDPLEVLLPNAQTTRAFLTVGESPRIGGFVNRQEHMAVTTSQVVAEVAHRAIDYVKGWWSGVGSASAATTAASANNVSKPVPPKTVDRSLALLGAAQSSGCGGGGGFTSMIIDPTQRYAACVDSIQGRVWLTDLTSGVIVRVWKGARNATCAWLLHEDEDNGKTALLLVVHLTYRGVVEFHAVNESKRIAAFKVDDSSCLLPTDSTDPTTCWFLRGDGTLFAVALATFREFPQIEAPARCSEGETTEKGGARHADPAFPHLLHKLASPELTWNGGGDELLSALLLASHSPNDIIDVVARIPTRDDAADFSDGSISWASVEVQQRIYDRLIDRVKSEFRPNPNDDCTFDFMFDAFDTMRNKWTASQVLNFCVHRHALVVAYAAFQEGRSPAAPAAAAASSAAFSGEVVPVDERVAPSEVPQIAPPESSSMVSAVSSFFTTSMFTGLITGGAQSAAAVASHEASDHAAAWRSLVVRRVDLLTKLSEAHVMALLAPPQSSTSTSTATRSPTPPPQAPSTVDPTTTPTIPPLPLTDFLSLFWCGGHKIKMLKGRADVTVMSRLASLVFGRIGPVALMTHSKTFMALGIDTATCIELLIMHLVDTYGDARSFTKMIDPRIVQSVIARLSADELHQIASWSGCLSPQHKISILALLLIARVDVSMRGGGGQLPAIAHAIPLSPNALATLVRDAERYLLLDRLLRTVGKSYANTLAAVSMVEVVARTPLHFLAVDDPEAPVPESSTAPTYAMLIAQLGTTPVDRALVRVCEVAYSVFTTGKYASDADAAAAVANVAQLLESTAALPTAAFDAAVAAAIPKKDSDRREALVSASILLLAVSIDVTAQLLVPLRETLRQSVEASQGFHVEQLKARLSEYLGVHVASRSARKYLQCCRTLVNLCGSLVASRLIVTNVIEVLVGGSATVNAWIEKMTHADDQRPFPAYSSRVRVALQRLSLLVSHNSDHSALLAMITDVSACVELCAILDEDGIESFATCEQWPAMFLPSTLELMATLPDAATAAQLDAIQSSRRQALLIFICSGAVPATTQQSGKPAKHEQPAKHMSTALRIQESLCITPADFPLICQLAAALAADHIADAENLLMAIQSRSEATVVLAWELRRRVRTFLHHFESEKVAAQGDKVKLALAANRQMAIESLLNGALAEWLRSGSTAKRTGIDSERASLRAGTSPVVAALNLDFLDDVGAKLGDSSVVRRALSDRSRGPIAVEKIIAHTRRLCALVEGFDDSYEAEIGGLLVRVVDEIRRQLIGGKQ